MADMSGDPPQGCWFGPWPYPTYPWPFQPPGQLFPVLPQPFVAPTSTEPVLLTAPPLSDADVDRIARRVVELLAEREAKP